MYRQLRLVSVILLMAIISSLDLCAKEDQPVLIVMPARKHVVSLAFDVAALRPAFLVSYQSLGKHVAPFMHIWDANKRTWLETNQDFYQQGVHFSTPPAAVYILGAANEVPTGIEAQPAWSAKQVHLTALDSMTVLNELNKSLDFSAREWEWLAGRHKLELKDLNEQKRRYGRYGPPERQGGSATTLSTPVQTIDSTGPVTPVPADTTIRSDRVIVEAAVVEKTPPVTVKPITKKVAETEREPQWNEAPRQPVIEKGMAPVVIDPGSK